MTIPDTSLNQTSNIIICIPAFNEEKNIESIIVKAKNYANEVIVYDDGSTDKTSEVSSKSGAHVIRSPRNRGYGRALSSLFSAAISRNASIVITLDSDGQHDPEQIPLLLAPLLNDEADIVIGSRFLNPEGIQNIPLYRNIGIRAITKVTRVACYKNITDSQSGFRAYNLVALSKLKLSENGMAISTEILLKADQHNLRIVEVPVTIRYDVDKGSTHHPIMHGFKVLEHIIQFISFRHPLLFYGLPGLTLLLFASLFLYNALELFSLTRYVSTNMIIISIGLSLIGFMLLATSAIIHTLVNLFKGKLNDA